MLARWLWDDWTRPSDLGLRMTKLGLLLLIATLIGNRILPKTIDLPVGDWLAIWLITKQPTSACGAPSMDENGGGAGRLVGASRRAIVLRLTSLRWLATPISSPARAA